MEHVKLSAKVQLVPPSVRSAEDKQKITKLHPFRSVIATISESYICPFCGKHLSGFSCNSEDFQNAFKKLQRFQGDHDYKSELHYIKFFDKFDYHRTTDSLLIKELSEDDIKALGLNVWDSATKVSDDICGYTYLVGNEVFEDKHISFLCKDVDTKKVYLCTMKDVDFQGLKVILGTWHKKKVATYGGNPDEFRCGNYHIQSSWRDIVTFENWEQFCRIIQAL